MKQYTARRTIPQGRELLTLIFAIGLVLFICMTTYANWVQFHRANEQQDITRRIMRASNTLLSTLKDAETGQRGFLVTGEESYLEPYNEALSRIPKELSELTTATAPSPDQARRVEAIKPLVQDKLGELLQTIELRRSKGANGALPIVMSGKGKATMDQIRRICAEMESVADRRFTRQSAEILDRRNEIGLVSTLGAVALLALLLLATATIQRGTRRRQQLIEELGKSEEETRQARDWMQTTLASVGDAVIATDAAAKITFLNEVAESLTGWTQEEATGVPLDQVFVISNDETGAIVESPVTGALREGRIVSLANDTNLIAKDGRKIPIDDSAAPIRDAAGKVAGVVLVFRNISQRKQAENELKQAEQRFRTAVLAVSDILWTNNAKGEMKGEQPGWGGFTGQSPDEYQGHGWAKAVHPDDAQPTIEAWNGAVSERRKFVFEHRVRRHDGIWRACSIRALPTLDAAGAIQEWVGVHTDITDRKVAEEALRESEHRYRLLFEQAANGIFIVDAQGCFANVNLAGCQMLGYTREELLGMTMADLAAPEEILRIEPEVARFTGGAVTTSEWRLRRKNGSVMIGEIVGRQLPDGQLQGVVRDITEQKQVRQSLEASEHRLRFMAESMPQKIFTANAQGNIEYFNKQWMDFTGLTFEQIRDWGPARLIHPDDVQENVRAWQHSIDTGEFFQFIHRFKRHDGIYRWHLSRAHAMRDEEGKIIMWLGSNTEIHEEREMQEQLARANEDLMQFAFAASHDLQEPLRMITSYSQLLVKSYRGQLDSEADICVQYIVDGTTRMRELLADLLAYTAVDTRTNANDGREPVDLNLVFHEVVNTLQTAIKESGAIVSSDSLPCVNGHRVHFMQLFQNLLGNAIKYRSKLAPCVHISAGQQNGSWRFAVTDNGMGIAPQHHEKIFGMFKRLHGKKIPGTGIGLAICQRVVERYQGRIWVDSQPDKGATFYFTVPVANEAKEVAA